MCIIYEFILRNGHRKYVYRYLRIKYLFILNSYNNKIIKREIQNYSCDE